MIHLRGEHTDVVIDESFGVPVVVHWGAPLGEVDPVTIGRALARSLVPGALDVVAPISVVPEHGAGFQGRPGLSGHRQGGTAWAPRFQPHAVRSVDNGVEVVAVDAVAGAWRAPSRSTRCSPCS